MMEEWIKVFIPLIGSLVGIAALWWKLTTTMATKQDILELRMDILRRQELRHATICRLDDRTAISILNNRLEAFKDIHHNDIMQVINKIDGVANDLRAEIRERVRDKVHDDEG